MNIQSAIKSTGKYLDQPLLISNFSKKVPGLLVGSAAAFGIYDTFNSPKKDRKDKAIRNTLVLGATVSSALIATRGLSLKKLPEAIKKFLPEKAQNFKISGLLNIPDEKTVKSELQTKISKFLSSNKVDDTTKNILEKAKNNPLNPGEVGKLSENLNKTKAGKKLFAGMIPEPADPTLKESMAEIVRLSKLGAVPVIGGVAGGVAADAITDKNWKNKVKDKVDEGLYQYLANIVLCNVGASLAILGMEQKPVKNLVNKLGVNPKLAKAGAMIGGIIATGVVGGSFLANTICKKIIDPICGKKREPEKVCDSLTGVCKDIYSDRHPEALDVVLHGDDMATVGVLSGFKWIEPALPLMYAISGYRAGIGYRNGNEDKQGESIKSLSLFDNFKEFKKS